MNESRLCSSHFCLILCGWIPIERQTNLESGSLARLTVHGDSAAVRFDNPIANRKSKAQPTPFLCGKKRLKNLPRGFSIDSVAGIAYRYGDSIG
jgi:hypothetical protein